MMVRLKTYNKLLDHFKNDNAKVEEWLRTPNNRLNGIKPIDLVQMGKHKELEILISEVFNL